MKGQEGKIITTTKDSVIVYIESLGLSLKAEISKAKVKRIGQEDEKQDNKYHF
jgi:hypothetical protein